MVAMLEEDRVRRQNPSDLHKDTPGEIEATIQLPELRMESQHMQEVALFPGTYH